MLENIVPMVERWGYMAFERLSSELVLPTLVSREVEDDLTRIGRGDTVNVLLNPTFQAIQRTWDEPVDKHQLDLAYVPVTLESDIYINLLLSAKDWNKSALSYYTQIVVPAIDAIAVAIENFIWNKLLYGVPGFHVPVNDPPEITDIAALLSRTKAELFPKQLTTTVLVGTLSNEKVWSIPEVHSAERRGDSRTLSTGDIGRVVGMNFITSQAVPMHTAGSVAYGGVPTIDGTVTAGEDTLSLLGCGASETINKGDLFSVAGSPGQYLFLEAATADSGGAIVDIKFTPKAPVGGFIDTAAVTILPSHSRDIAFTPQCCAAAIIPMAVPKQVLQQTGVIANMVYAKNDVGILITVYYDQEYHSPGIFFSVGIGATVAQPTQGLWVPFVIES